MAANLADNYVHRLVQSKEDGKLVEVPGHGDVSRHVGCGGWDLTVPSYFIQVTDDEKVDTLQLEVSMVSLLVCPLRLGWVRRGRAGTVVMLAFEGNYVYWFKCF